MKTRILAAALMVAGLGACAAPDIAARQMTLSGADLMATPVAAAAPDGEVLIAQYNVREVRVTVPEKLSVSEANLYYPVADIVWRGDLRGDRHAQVRAIVEEAFAKGTAGMKKGPGVIVEAEMRRFHALSEKTRYSVGGVYSIHFDLTVRDAESGAAIDGPRLVTVNIKASGGRRAIEEEARGLTQRVVITHNLAHAILRELSVKQPVPQDMQLSRLDDDLRLSLTAVSMKNELTRTAE